MNTFLSIAGGLGLLAILTDPVTGQIVINEIHAVSNGRFLRYAESGQGHLGSGPSWWEAGFPDAGWQSGGTPAGFGYPVTS